MKKFLCFFLFLMLLFACGCSEITPRHGLNVVFIDDTFINIESVFGDDDSVRLINSVDLIVKGTVTESYEPEYLGIGFPQFVHKITVSEVIKGENVAVGDEISLLSHCGYDDFRNFAKDLDNYDLVRKFTSEELEKYSADPTAKVEIAVQNGTPLYVGGEFVLLLCAPEEGKENWTLWSDRSSVLAVDGEKLNGYAAEYLGDTYAKFLKNVSAAQKTPDVKYDEAYLAELRGVPVENEEENPMPDGVISQFNVSDLPDIYSETDSEEYVKNNKVYILDNFPLDYSLVELSESPDQWTAYYYLGNTEKSTEIDYAQTMQLTWTDLSPWDLDVHEYMKDLMSLEPGMKYIDNSENYMFYDYTNSSEITKRKYYWGEGDLLFCLTIPISYCDKIVSVDMFSTDLTNEIEVFEPILETQEIDIITSPFEVNSNQNQDLEPVVPSEP